jgi:hypothetical protein
VVETTSTINGPPIQGIVDAARWKDSILVLDRHGLIWIIDPQAQSIRRVVSLKQAFGNEVDRPLAVLGDEEGFGAWDAGNGSLYWFSVDGTIRVRRDVVINLNDLFLSGFRPLEPPRMHGRLIERNRHLYLEMRRGDQQTQGPLVDATIVRYSRGKADTMLSFRAPSHSEFRAGVRICCGRPRFFSPQPWWAPLSDGRLVFTDGKNPELLMYSSEGAVVRRVAWQGDPRDRRPSRRDFLNYLYEDTRREFPDASAKEIRSLNRKITARVDRFLGALSDTVPSVTQLIVDNEDRLWVRRFDRSRWPDGLSSTWDVFDSGFRYLAYLELPSLDYVFEIKDGKILGTEIVHGALQRIRLVPFSAY